MACFWTLVPESAFGLEDTVGAALLLCVDEVAAELHAVSTLPVTIAGNVAVGVTLLDASNE